MAATEGNADADDVPPEGAARAVRVAQSEAAGGGVPDMEAEVEASGGAVGATESDPCSEPLLKNEGVPAALGAGLAVPKNEAENIADTAGAALMVAAPGLALAQDDAVGVCKGDAV